MTDLSPEEREELAERSQAQRRTSSRDKALAKIWQELGGNTQAQVAEDLGQADMTVLNTRSGSTTVGELRGWLARGQMACGRQHEMAV